MYTQCPDCHIAFRVTAKVLQQAGGRVQCGGCNLAFNAVDFLSENPPVGDAAIDPAVEQPAVADSVATTDAVESSSDELELNDDEVAAKQSFEERNTELLKALDDLAGPEEIRIEDTGIEWRVLEKGEELDQANDDVAPTDGQTALEFGNVAPDEQRYDDSTLLPDDFEDEQLDKSPTPSFQSAHDTEEPAEELPVLEDAQVDLAFGDPDEWLDLLDDVLEQQSDHANDTDASADSAKRDLINDTGNAALRMEAEEELSAIHSELSATLEPYAGATEDEAVIADDETLEVDDDATDEDKSFEDEDDLPDEEEALEDEDDLVDEEEALEDGDELADEEAALEDDADLAEDEAPEADDFRSQIALIEGSLADDLDDDKTDQQDAPAVDERADGPDTGEVDELDIEKELAASSEYEPESATSNSAEQKHTVNVQMHEDMRRAMEDEEFAATMTSEDGSPLFETIIMEGDFVHGSIDDETDESESKLPSDIDEPKSLIDTYVLSRRGKSGKWFLSTSGPAVIAGVIVLALLLAGQYVHKSREFLATYGMFNQTIGPVYRALGNPVMPAWDIKGWRFETTNGSTDESAQLLTIFSSIANRSSQPLPYPLVHVSLTDRWEEIVGSRVLEPNEYLAGNPDPRRPVAAGDKFTAVISIASPAEEVTGFKLNVCYRVDSERLSCAIEDFKN